MQEGDPILGGVNAVSNGANPPAPNSGATPTVPGTEPVIPAAQPTPAPTPAPTAIPNPTPPTDPLTTPTPDPTPTPSSTSFPQPDFTTQFMQSVKSSTESKDTGDIIINNGNQSKSPKKAIIIGGLVCAAILICAIVGLVIFSGKQSTPTTATTPNLSAATISNFNSYANDLLYGTDSTNNPSEDRMVYSYSERIFNDPGLDQNYLKQLSQKYDTFYKQLQTEPTLSSYSDLVTATNNYKQLLDFLKVNPTREYFDPDYITELYLENGETAATQASKQILALGLSDNQYADAFTELKSTVFADTIEYLNALTDAGCITDSIDELCADNLYDEYEEVKTLKDGIQQKDKEAYDLLTDDYFALGTDCWQIRNLIEGQT